MTLLRPITAEDHATVLRLNHDDVELLAPLDEARLLQLRGWADRADVIEHEGEVAGFVITFAPGTAYDSVNYRWFCSAYDDFYYLDRIVLAERFRRHGLGSRVYEELESVARPRGLMALEVNLEPPNEPSLAFHDRRGYAEVATQEAQGKVVSLRVRRFEA